MSINGVLDTWSMHCFHWPILRLWVKFSSCWLRSVVWTVAIFLLSLFLFLSPTHTHSHIYRVWLQTTGHFCLPAPKYWVSHTHLFWYHLLTAFDSHVFYSYTGYYILFLPRIYLHLLSVLPSILTELLENEASVILQVIISIV